MENKIISALVRSREAYNEVKDTLETADFSDVGGIIVSHIIDYYNQDASATYVDTDVIKARLDRAFPHRSEVFTTVIDGLPDVSVPNMLQEYVDLRLQGISRKLAALLATGRANSETQELMRQYQFLSERREEGLMKDEKDLVFENISVADIMEELTADKLIPIYPRSVNEAIGGGAPPGSHIVVFARPESGKTMFCINMLGGFARSKRTALYIGNEDPHHAIIARIISNLAGMRKSECQADPQEAQERADANGLNYVRFASLHPGSVADVRRLVAMYKPQVVMVDQIRNLRTPKSFTKVESLEYVAQEMRNIAKEHNCVVISVTQAGDSADGKLDLSMGDVDFSNTGIPSTADVMIGIGVTPAFDVNNKRKLSLPKNKLGGNHNGIVVSVRPDYSEVYDE